MKTYNQAIIEADQKILQVGNFSEARYLMLELCQENNVDLYKDLDKPINEQINKMFQQGVKKLLKHEPVAHVLGYSYFYGYRFTVNKNVLIPRNETELLVMNALLEIDSYFNTSKLNVIDLACGSGAIGITMKLENPELNIDMSDISPLAIETAKKNIQRYQLDISLRQDDMLKNAVSKGQKYDVIICNPPYIHDDENLEKSVFEYEPHLALFGGVDGLDFYRQVLKQSQLVLNKPGMLGFEIGYNQKKKISKEIKKVYPNAKIKHFKDYANLDRMVFIFI